MQYKKTQRDVRLPFAWDPSTHEWQQWLAVKTEEEQQGKSAAGKGSKKNAGDEGGQQQQEESAAGKGSKKSAGNGQPPAKRQKLSGECVCFGVFMCVCVLVCVNACKAAVSKGQEAER